MRIQFLVCMMILTPFAALAEGHDNALARMEAGSVAMTNNLLDFYISRAPELAASRPDMTWDDAYREAGQCVLDGLAAYSGEAGVAAYLAALESFSTVEIATFRDLTQKMPDVLAEPVALELSSTCGMIALGTARMEDSGLTAAFAEDGVMERVLAPAE